MKVDFFRKGFLVGTLVLTTFLTTGGQMARADTQQEVTIWIQTMDSCQKAIPGAQLVLQGDDKTYNAEPGQGSKPKTVASAHGHCPLQRGNCATISVGCITFSVALPTTEAVTYTLTQPDPIAPNPHDPNNPGGYAPCEGGSACQFESSTITVNTDGSVNATTTNIYPDGYTQTWPLTGSPYAATQADPIVFHDFGIGNGSCDGDNDNDDHLTGTPGSHCDSDNDRYH